MKLAFRDRPWTKCCRLYGDLADVKPGPEALQSGIVLAGAAQIEDLHALLPKDTGHLRY
jgi:hypothetical protein